ncbi:MAG: type II toxin-antitoxin system RelE/ParE family toxin [Cyanobacteria bacterium J06627_32]
MYSIRFTEQADADLLSIYVYTYNTWNEAQAIEYTDGLKAAVNQLAKNPSRLGTVDRSAVRPGYRSYRYQSHLVFYRVSGQFGLLYFLFAFAPAS